MIEKTKKLVLLILFSIGSIQNISCAKVPVKILSIYGGYSVDKDSIEEVKRSYLDPAYKAKFNAIELKILGNKIDLTNPDQFRRMKQLSDAAKKRGLGLMCYTFANPWNGKRFPEKDSELPPFVSEDGKVIEDKFSLIHWPTFRQLFENAFQLAAISRKLPIKAIKIDLESIHNMGISYDDRAWKLFAGENGLPEKLSIAERIRSLKSRNLNDSYKKWFQEQLGKVAKRFEREMHLINPSVKLGMMPAHKGWFYEAFIKNLATPEMPAIMDSWIMYNINGFTKQVLEEQEYIKNLNPDNIFIPWFRINNYYPDDIGVQAYHAAFGTDGYSAWVLTMLREDQNSLLNYHKLPQSHSPQEYWNGFAKANKAIRADLNIGKLDANSIPYVSTRSVAPQIIGLDSLEIPLTTPIGNGNGHPSFCTLRDQQVFHIFADAGEEIKMDIRHLAGKRRAVALNYALLDREHRILRNETVSPGATESFSVTAPLTGTYALVVTGGEAGSAWYGVRIQNKHAGLRLPVYIFYAGRKPQEFWLARSDMKGAAKVKIKTNQNQVIAVQLNDGPIAEGSYKNDIVLELPANRKIHKLRLMSPENVPETKYVQDFLVTVEGNIEPYLFDAFERGIMKIKK